MTPLTLNSRTVAALYWSLATVKPVLGIAATGLVALLLWKVLLVFLLPFIGIAAAFLFLVVKVALVGVMICVAIWLLRRRSRQEETPV